jgi:hypothetical protein
MCWDGSNVRCIVGDKPKYIVYNRKLELKCLNLNILLTNNILEYFSILYKFPRKYFYNILLIFVVTDKLHISSYCCSNI